MTGRLENKIKIENKLLNELKDKPEYLLNYYYSLAAEGDSANSWGNYVHQVTDFMLYTFNGLDEEFLLKITRSDIEKYLISKQTKELYGERVPTSFQYRKRCYNLLKKFFVFLMESGLIITNPMEHIKKPVGADNVKRCYLTRDDMKTLLNAIHNPTIHDKSWVERNELIAMLFMSTGMRNTAMSELNLDNIDFNKKELTVIDKRSKTHVFVLSDQIICKIKQWLRIRQFHLGLKQLDALFINDKNERLSAYSIQDMIYKYTERAWGKRMSPHKLRAAFCTIMYEMTGNIEEVRRMVGHSRVETTQRYIVDDGQAKRDAAMLTSSYLF